MIKIKKIFLDGCGPCIASEAILEPFGEDKIERWDITDREELMKASKKYGITKVPTLIFFDDWDRDELELYRLEVDFTENEISQILDKLWD